MNTTLSIAAVRLDGGTQPRVERSADICSEYAEAMQAGDTFPPVTVFHDGENYWLADGFHRIGAAKVLERSEIDAEVRQGTQRDAVLYSVGANATHGWRRSNSDKRAAVTRLLRDEEWSRWSDSEIARRIKVSQPFVSKLRGDLTYNVISENRLRGGLTSNVTSENRTYITKHGTTAKMHTANIGKPKPDAEPKEQGGYTKPGFVPENPNMVYIDNQTGEVFHDPISPDERRAGKEAADFTIDIIDHLEWLLTVSRDDIRDKVLPEDREEVDGLLAKAAVHLRNLQHERQQTNGTREKRIKQAHR